MSICLFPAAARGVHLGWPGVVFGVGEGRKHTHFALLVLGIGGRSVACVDDCRPAVFWLIWVEWFGSYLSPYFSLCER